MGQGGIYSKHQRRVRAGNTRVSETSLGRKDWKAEISSQAIPVQKQSQPSPSAGMPPVWLASSSSLGYVLSILTPLGLRVSQPVGQLSGRPAALAGISGSTGLFFGLSTGNTSSSAPRTAFCSAAVSSAAPGSAFPQERAVEPHRLPAPLHRPRGATRVSRGRATDFVHELETTYGNIQEMLCTFNNENRFWVNEFVVAFIWLEVFSVTHTCWQSHKLKPVTCWFHMGLFNSYSPN